MGTWRVGVGVFDTPQEETEVEADTLLDAIDQGVTDLGYDGNDEGRYTVTATLLD